MKKQKTLDPSKLVFIDESAAKTNMTCLRGRAPRGERLHMSAPHGHWRTTTMISSIRLDGSTASMVIEGAMDTEVFRSYVSEVLCPSLKEGDLVVMDNLSVHKSEITIAMIEEVGASVHFLPAYSPDLNPIEKMWSKVKALLRTIEARSYPDLIEAIASALSRVTSQDASGCFSSCGYNFI